MYIIFRHARLFSNALVLMQFHLLYCPCLVLALPNSDRTPNYLIMYLCLTYVMLSWMHNIIAAAGRWPRVQRKHQSYSSSTLQWICRVLWSSIEALASRDSGTRMWWASFLVRIAPYRLSCSAWAWRIMVTPWTFVFDWPSPRSLNRRELCHFWFHSELIFLR